ncbi:MAG: hypothetical protein ACK48N_02665, partial [Planctomyces sp.]
MREVTSVINRASRRLLINRLLQGAVLGVIGVAGVAGTLLVLERLGLVGVNWRLGAMIAPGAVACVALVRALVRSPGRSRVAMIVDDAAGTREALSTAMHVERSGDAWSANVLEHARAVAR